MLLIDFSARGWEYWDVERQPLIREGMPVLVDDDLRFEDGPGDQRPAVVVNRWLRELPVNSAPARRTWRVYAEAVRAWLEFLSERGVAPFGSREELRSVLSVYAGYRLSESPAASLGRLDVEPARHRGVAVLRVGAAGGLRQRRAIQLLDRQTDR